MSAADDLPRRSGQAHPGQGRRLRHARSRRGGSPSADYCARSRPAQGPARQQRPAQPDPPGAGRGDRRRASPRPAPTSSPPTPSTPTRSARPIMAPKPSSPRSTAPRRGSSARSPTIMRKRRQAALGRGRARPDQQDPVAVARRQRSRLSRGRFRHDEGGLSRAGRRAGRRRRRFHPDRDDLRHAERQGGDHGGARGRARRWAGELPLMISMTLTDLSGRNLSGHTVEAFWASRAPCQAADDRPQLLVRRGAAAAASRGAGGQAPTRWSWPIPTPACPTSSANMTRRPQRPRRRCAEWIDDGLVNIVGGCCGTTAEHHRRDRRGGARTRGRRATFPNADGHTLLAGPRADGARAALTWKLRAIDQAGAGARLRQHRRALQRHRLGQVQEADPRRRL